MTNTPTAVTPASTWMNPARERRMYRIGLVAAVFWAVSTELLDRRWYPLHGINYGDLLFGAWLGFALLRRSTAGLLIAAFHRIKGQLLVIALLALWLLASVAVNTMRFGATWSDVFAILRLFYFAAIMVFCVAYVRRFGPSPLLLAFVAGIVLLTIGRLLDAPYSGPRLMWNLYMLKDPNVIGNMLGVGIAFNTLLLLYGWTILPLVLTVFFAASSVQTYSKGTWLMVALGVASNLLALFMRQRLTRRAIRRAIAGMAVFALLVVGLLYRSAVPVYDLIAHKVRSTGVSGSAEHRYRFALTGFYAMRDYPVFGLGFRNYSRVEQLYPGLMPEPSENAHNAFVQVGAIAGVPGLLLLMMAFTYPFWTFWKLIRLRSRGLRGLTMVTLMFLMFLISGSVQLQLVAQPFFWFFAAVVRGWYFRVLDSRAVARRAAPSPPQRAVAAA